MSSSSTRQAFKKAKSKLHQVSQAYITPANQRRIDDLLDSIEDDVYGANGMPEAQGAPRADGVPETQLRSLCLEILKFHASTRERLPYLKEAYQKIMPGSG